MTRRVASQRQDVHDPIVFTCLKSLSQLVLWHVGAGQVHHHIEIVVLQCVNAEVEGRICCGTTCTPCDIDPHWIQLRHTIKTFIKILDTDLCFRREVLKRKPWYPRLLYQVLRDLFGHLGHSCLLSNAKCS